MDLQSYLMNMFETWRPSAPTVEGRTKRDITLRWSTEPFDFLEGDLLFWVQKKEKMPPWVVVYSGGKMTKTIDNLAPRHPHKFRVKVILKATAVSTLAYRALERFGNEEAVYEHFEGFEDTDTAIKENRSVNIGRSKSIKNNTVIGNKLDMDLNEPITNEKGDSDVSEIVKEEVNKNDGGGDMGRQINSKIRSDMDLQSYLMNMFETWRPSAPTVEGRTKRDITLRWSTEPFDFLEGDLLFWVQKKEKMPPWVVVYSGGKMTKTIDNLAPRHPHKFRVKVILKATAVSTLAYRALERFGNEEAVYEHFEGFEDTDTAIKENRSVNIGRSKSIKNNTVIGNKLDMDLNEPITNEKGDSDVSEIVKEEVNKNDGGGDMGRQINSKISPQIKVSSKKWIESQWSEETSTSTDTDGTSAVCFSMAVRCGYLKQVQAMLEERPDLIEIVNSSNGFTPLATAVRKGDLNTVKFLITAGANVNETSSSGQSPLHLAALGALPAVLDLLLDNGADFQARDLNGLRIEHYAVDAGSAEMLTHILQRGGDLSVKDNNGWTPLFRAVTQGASTELIELLVLSGSDVNAADYAGLGLPSAARLLHNRHGRDQDSILRLIDSQYPHEQAVANFTRLTKKISSLHTILKCRPFCTKPRSNTPLTPPNVTPNLEPVEELKSSTGKQSKFNLLSNMFLTPSVTPTLEPVEEPESSTEEQSKFNLLSNLPMTLSVTPTLEPVEEPESSTEEQSKFNLLSNMLLTPSVTPTLEPVEEPESSTEEQSKFNVMSNMPLTPSVTSTLEPVEEPESSTEEYSMFNLLSNTPLMISVTPTLDTVMEPESSTEEQSNFNLLSNMPLTPMSSVTPTLEPIEEPESSME